MKIINPANEEIIGEVHEDTHETLKNKFAVLKSGQGDWQKRSLGERIAVLKNFSGYSKSR
jgi:acyl-CoA reductase-like NAD-dependent aldehyde dehydrogenase